MAETGKKSGSERARATQSRPNDSCEWYERNADLQCEKDTIHRETHAGATRIAEDASGGTNTPLHSRTASNAPLPDRSVRAPASGLTDMGQRLVDIGKTAGASLDAVAQAHKRAQERWFGDASTGTPAGLLDPSSLTRSEFDIGNINVQTEGEYNSRLGIIGHIDATAMITDDMAITIGGSLGARQKEWLVQAGFEPIDGLFFKGTFRQLRQKLDFDFQSGRTQAEVMETTMGMSVEWAPNIKGMKWLEKVGAEAYHSKAPSVDLEDKKFVIETSTLYQLWRDPRKIAGSVTDGGSLIANIRLGEDDALRVSFGMERFERLTQESTGVKLRPTGSGMWEHTVTGDSWASGIQTGLGLSSQSGAPLALQAKISQRLGENWDMQGSVSQGLVSEKDGVWGVDAGKATSIRAGFTYHTPVPKPMPEPKHHDVRTPSDPIDAHISRATNGGIPLEDTASRNKHETEQERAKRIMGQTKAKPWYNPGEVRGSVDETARPVLDVAADKTSLPAGSSIDALGNAHLEAGVALGTMISAINGRTGADLKNLFTINGTQLDVNLNALDPYIVGATQTSPDTITITTTTTVVTIQAWHGSVHIASVTAVESGSVNDTTPPLTTSSPSVSSTTSSGTTLSAKISEAGTGYYLVQAANVAAPSAATVKASGTSFAMAANTATSTNITGLSASTGYKVYFVAQDSRGNLQTSVESASFTTEAVADVTGPQLLTEIGGGPSQTLQEFDMAFNFNEPVVDVSDMALTTGGTGFSYTLENGGNRVRIKGVPTNEGDARVTFKVKDAANNSSDIISQGTYEVFAPAS